MKMKAGNAGSLQGSDMPGTSDIQRTLRTPEVSVSVWGEGGRSH